MNRVKLYAITVIELLLLYVVCVTVALISKMIWISATGAMPVNFSGSHFILLVSLSLFLITAFLVYYYRRKVRKIVTTFFLNEKSITDFQWFSERRISCYLESFPVVMSCDLRFMRYRKLFTREINMSLWARLEGETTVVKKRIAEIQADLDSADKGPDYELWAIFLTEYYIVTSATNADFKKIDPDKYFGELKDVLNQDNFIANGEIATVKKIVDDMLYRIIYRLFYMLVCCWLALMVSKILIRLITVVIFN